MRHSTERRYRRRWRASAAVLGLVLVVCASASAEDGTLRIRQSALTRFAAAVQPLTISRSFERTFWVPNPFLGGLPTPVYVNCNANASVTGLTFAITAASATVRGNVSGSVCNIGYQSTLSTTVTIALDPAGRSLLIRPGLMAIAPTVKILGLFNVTPFTVELAPALTVASIPLDAARFEIETPAGPRTFVLASRNLQLSLQNGYVEIKGDALFR